MFTARKIFTTVLVALTVATAAVSSTGTAQAGGFGHHGHHGRHGHWGWGAGGLATGLIIGSTLGARTVYAEPVRRCVIVERTNRWGEVVGTRKVCRSYYED